MNLEDGLVESWNALRNPIFPTEFIGDTERMVEHIKVFVYWIVQEGQLENEFSEDRSIGFENRKHWENNRSKKIIFRECKRVCLSWKPYKLWLTMTVQIAVNRWIIAKAKWVMTGSNVAGKHKTISCNPSAILRACGFSIRNVDIKQDHQQRCWHLKCTVTEEDYVEARQWNYKNRI